jgi:hypothetical protein
MSRPALPSPRSIHFDIGRITLHGYSSRERDRFERALRTHLTALARQPGAWPASGDSFIERLDAGAIPPGASPERAAQLIANRVVGAVAGAAPVDSTAAAVGHRGPNA